MSELVPLEPGACLALLAGARLGRVGVIVDGYALVFPVNYVLAERDSVPVIVIRTRVGNVISTHPGPVSFEIDGIDEMRQCGWSVLVRGELGPLTGVVFADPEPWVNHDRTNWMIITAQKITGRELVPEHQLWPFHPNAYL